jgi:hypothetical protein
VIFELTSENGDTLELAINNSPIQSSEIVYYGLPRAGLVQKTAFPRGSGQEFRATGVPAYKPVDEKPSSKRVVFLLHYFHLIFNN